MIQAKCYKYSDPSVPALHHDLEVGKIYEVSKISMGQFFSSKNIKADFEAILKKYPEKIYNSVFFEFFEDGKPLNIYNDKRFNPYLKNEKG